MTVKTKENPKTKKSVFKLTFFKAWDFLSPLFISSTETPEMKERYAGIKGKTQGETKEMSPAVKAANKETFSMHSSRTKCAKTYLT
jgi:hypothetical protein